jgi:D-aminopeptidase
LSTSAALHMTRQTGGFHQSYLGGALAGEGGIVSTIDDMLRWLRHMNHPIVGSAETWRLIRTSQTLRNGTSTGYGFGLHSECFQGMDLQHHSGGGLGGSAHLARVPALGLDVIVLVNREDVSATSLAEKVLAACMGRWLIDVSRATEAAGTAKGVFCSRKTHRVIELGHADGLQAMSIDGLRMPTERGADGALRPAGIFRSMKQVVHLQGPLGCPESLRLNDYGNDDILIRKPGGPPNADVIVGRYRWNADLQTEATIYMGKDGPRMTTIGCFGKADYQLVCIAEGIWRAQVPGILWRGGVLTFPGTGRTFLFSTYRTRALEFDQLD